MTPIVVLLVEDEAGDALLASQMLAEAPFPVRLHIARDGAQALQMLSDEAFKPSVVILDLNLPEINGFRLLERYHRADIPVVIFSASAKESDKLLAKSLGASEYVLKPTELDAFREAVWGMVERWGRNRTGLSGAATH